MQKLLENKKFLKIMIFVTTLAVLIGVVFLIYFKDQPKIIPEETRGEVREAVAEEIVKPIAKVAPVFAKKIENASFDNKDSINKSVVTNGVASATANWPTYKNEELGFELKYPEGWVVAENETVINLNQNEESPYGLTIYFNILPPGLSPSDWWAAEIHKSGQSFELKSEGVINGKQMKKYKEIGGLEEAHTLIDGGEFVFDILQTGGLNDIEADKIISTFNF